MELYKSDGGNILVKTQITMIDLDSISKKLNIISKDFKERFATADALYLIIKNGKIKLFFIEFKNKDFTVQEQRLKEKYNLKKLILEIEDKSMKSKFLKHHEKLIDKSMLRLRIKPYDSLSVIFYFMKHYFGENYVEKCLYELQNMEKSFILVSKTKTEYTPLFKNKSNRNNNIIKPLRFLKRLVPYYYNHVLTLPDSKFDHLMYKLNNV